VLRFHKKCRFRGKNYNAMIALFRDCLTDEPKAIQRTLLTREGRKIGHAMLGPVEGCAIKIDRLTGDHLAIGEGLESCLSGRVFGCVPAWALGSAGAITSFQAIPNVQSLTIFGENDANGAIAACRTRWEGAARVFRINPGEGCSDLNDAWQALPQASLQDRTAIFDAICKRVWPGARMVPLPQGPSVLDALKRMGYPAWVSDAGQDRPHHQK
jgi:hypothetical protein